ncbi:MAG: radical SAM protein [Deltaproteobacteria bacterium]|nr:radical SAM protein [Deltaproteobacteria bacterium]
MNRALEKDLVDLGFHLSRRTGIPLVRPDWVSINVTLRCNLKCEMCVTCYDAPDELGTGELVRIIDQVADWGVPIVNLLGGEPTIRKDIAPVLKRAQQRGLLTTLTTNGTLWDTEMLELVAGLNMVHVNFSIDGLEQTHDSIRGKGTFKKVTSTLSALRQAEDKYTKNPGFYRKAINVNSLVTSANLEELVDLARLAKALGADKIQFLNLFDHGPAARKSRLWIKEKDLPGLDRAIDRLIEYFKQDKQGFGPVNSLEDLAMIKQYYRGTMKPEDAPCYNGYKELYINVNGDGLMCDGKLNFLNGSFGNARRQPIKEMWTSSAARTMRKRVAACEKPCLQDCYLRRESDDPVGIITSMAGHVMQGLGILGGSK